MEDRICHCEKQSNNRGCSHHRIRQAPKFQRKMYTFQKSSDLYGVIWYYAKGNVRKFICIKFI